MLTGTSTRMGNQRRQGLGTEFAVSSRFFLLSVERFKIVGFGEFQETFIKSVEVHLLVFYYDFESNN